VQIILNRFGSARELGPFKDGDDAIVVEVSRNFLLEIAEQIMRIPVLKAFRAMERYSITQFPEAPLSDETAPDVRHAGYSDQLGAVEQA
jgi:hypothetical protein